MKRVAGAIALLLVPLLIQHVTLIPAILNHLHDPAVFGNGYTLDYLVIDVAYFVCAGLWWFRPSKTNIVIKVFVVLAQVAALFILALVAVAQSMLEAVRRFSDTQIAHDYFVQPLAYGFACLLDGCRSMAVAYMPKRCR